MTVKPREQVNEHLTIDRNEDKRAKNANYDWDGGVDNNGDYANVYDTDNFSWLRIRWRCLWLLL